ncbi:MFS transporter [Bacillus smithii]|uniref:MFS transporter n=1 Tax=Bacillus smithii TaxID=1479 RepID=UPI002E1E1668|nr:MFS transporter [Bacillus smithii]
MLRNRWQILILATWIQMTAAMITQGMGPLSTYWGKMDLLTPTQTAILVSAINVGPLFSMMFLGKAIDLYGERWILGISSLLLGLTMGATLLSHHYIYLIMILMIVGAWYGASQPGGSKAIVHWFPVKERGLALGIRQTGIPLGGAIAAASIPWLSIHFGVSTAILVQSGLAIVSGFLFLLLYQDAEPAKSESENQKDPEEKENWKSICFNKTLYPVFFVGVSLVSLQFILVAHFMGFLTNELKVSLTKAGLYLAVVQVSGMLGRVVLAWVSDNWLKGNRVRPLILCIVMAMASIFSLLWLDEGVSSWLLVGISIVLGFFGMGWYSLYIVYVSENGPEDQIAYTVSIGLTLNQIAIIAAPVLFGLIVDWQKSYTIAWIFLMMIIASGGLMLLKLPSKSGLKKVDI